MSETTSTHQQLMNQAYAFWTGHDNAVRSDYEATLQRLAAELGENHEEIYNVRRELAERLWSMETFWAQLSARELIAVLTGNMNYQVENGGWLQWCDNGYVQCADELETILRESIGTKAAVEVADMVARVAHAWEQFQSDKDDTPPSAFCHCEDEDECECETEEDIWQAAHDEFCGVVEPLDSRFYEINEQFMTDVEAFLKGEGNSTEQSAAVKNAQPDADPWAETEPGEDETESPRDGFHALMRNADEYADYCERQAQAEAEESDENDGDYDDSDEALFARQERFNHQAATSRATGSLSGLPCRLIGTDGNAFAVIGSVSNALKRGGRRDLVEPFRQEATSGDYNGVLKAAMKYVEVV
jgi:hypothetical protein